MQHRCKFLVALAAVALSCLPAHAQEEEKVLHMANWSEYIADDTLKNFEKETGIKVVYDTFDSNEILHAKLVAGKTGYDLVVPSSTFVRQQIEGGLLRKLDKSLLPNLSNLDPLLQEKLTLADPGNQYMVNWLWGYTTVGINVDKVKAALGAKPLPEDAWDLVFKPEYLSKLKGCGVSFLDSPSEIVPLALLYLGKSVDTRNPADFAAAGALLKTIRPYVTLFNSAGYMNDLAAGSNCLAIGWSGDLGVARRRAMQTHNGNKIQTLIPKTGSMLFFDGMVIPADAPHPHNAHKFINYILRGEVHAGLSNKLNYANPNLASRPFVKAEVANDPSVFLSNADMATMVSPAPLTNEVRRLMARTYTSFKSGL
jgi:putrescine transport system substrate-binding protein